MTILISDNSPRISYTATAGQTVFTVPFEFFDNSDLNVYINDVLKTITTDYAVTGGDGSTGTVTLVTGATVGDAVVITRDVTLERVTDFPTSGPFQVASLNVELDKLVAMVADLKDLANRGLRLSDSDLTASLTLASPNDRKGTVLAFNETTGDAEVGPTISDVSGSAANASAAASSATAAASSAVSAANSAAAAAAAFDSFDDTYLGSFTSDPATDNDGNPLVEGALYFNSPSNEMRVYDGANWIAATSAGAATMSTYKYTATASQTTFSGSDDSGSTLSYSVNNLIVTLNGLVLENGADYTATDGTSIVLTVAASVNDELNIIAFTSFSVGQANVDSVNGQSGVVVLDADDISDASTTNKYTTAGDISKLAGIEANATADQTAAEIKTAYESNADTNEFSDAEQSKLAGIAANAEVNTVDSVNTQTGTVVLDAADVGALALTGGTLTGDLSFGDNNKAIFGAGSDLEIFHNGSNSLIKDNGTGNLNITTNGTYITLLGASGAQNMARFQNGGTVELYHNGNKKLNTTGTGVAITGNLDASDGIYVGGTNSYIYEGAANQLNFRIGADGPYAEMIDIGGGVMEFGNSGGALALTAAGTERARLTSAGLEVTGTVTSGAATISSFQPTLTLEDTVGGAQDDAQIRADASILRFRNGTSDTTRMEVSLASGDVSFFEDTGTTVKFFWDASTERLGLGTISPTATLDVAGELIATSYNETYYALLAGAAVTIDCHSGNCFSLTTSTNTTFTFSNPPASGTAFGFSLELTAGGTHTITYPASVDWAGGTAPDAPASGETDVLVFTTHDGGTTWYGFRAGDAMA